MSFRYSITATDAGKLELLVITIWAELSRSHALNAPLLSSTTLILSTHRIVPARTRPPRRNGRGTQATVRATRTKRAMSPSSCLTHCDLGAGDYAHSSITGGRESFRKRPGFACPRTLGRFRRGRTYYRSPVRTHHQRATERAFPDLPVFPTCTR